MTVYQQLAEFSQYISPKIYKNRFFKKQKGLTFQNVLERKVEPELVWLQNFLPKDAVCFDIGANVGSYIYQLENQLLPENIYAFEPNQELASRLKRLFPKIHVSEIALSNENTLAEFKIPIINGKKIHTRGTLQTDLKEVGEERIILQKVKVQKLDNFVKEKNIYKIDFIKIDVEGNEHFTLQGAKEVLKNRKPTLLVEMEQRHHAEPLWNLITEILEIGYSANYLCRKNFELKPLTEEFLQSQDQKNVKNYENYINNIIFLPH